MAQDWSGVGFWDGQQRPRAAERMNARKKHPNGINHMDDGRGARPESGLTPGRSVLPYWAIRIRYFAAYCSLQPV